MASEAEERIREKVVRQMRMYWPSGRIIHELQCGQGEHRLDVACVTEDRLVLAEVKSERDVLTRAEKQLAKALCVANEVWLVVAEEQLEAVKEAPRRWRRLNLFWESPAAEDEPKFHYGVKLWTEKDKELASHLVPAFKMWEAPWFDLSPLPHALFDLLWAEEMRAVIGDFFGGATLPGSERSLGRSKMTRLAVEHMSGREIRRSVCRCLRARYFPRADAAIPWEAADALSEPR